MPTIKHIQERAKAFQQIRIAKEKLIEDQIPFYVIASLASNDSEIMEHLYETLGAPACDFLSISRSIDQLKIALKDIWWDCRDGFFWFKRETDAVEFKLRFG